MGHDFYDQYKKQSAVYFFNEKTRLLHMHVFKRVFLKHSLKVQCVVFLKTSMSPSKYV